MTFANPKEQKKELTERDQRIHALAKEQGITLAAAASIVDAQDAKEKDGQ